MMTTLHQVNDLSRVGEKPACCIGAARGHCTVHCPRIEDVLYSQRKGKTNKGAQRWRCKACGTKWTSKGIIQPPPVVPDTIVNSIGFGNGPEELSIDQLRANARPYKKTKTLDQTMLPSSPFPSLFGNTGLNNNNNNNSNNNIHNGNSSPNGSPIPSPPSPVSFLQRTNSFVPILPTTTSSSSSNNNINNSNSISNSVINSLRQSQNSTSSLSSSSIQQQQQQQLSQSQQGINSSRSSSTSLSQSQKNTQTLTTKPIVVGIPSNSMNSSGNSINTSPNLQILNSNNNNNSNNSNSNNSNKNILYNGQPSPNSNNSNNNSNSNNNNNNNNNMSISSINSINNSINNSLNNFNNQNIIQRPSLSTNKLLAKQPSSGNLSQHQQQQQQTSPQPPLSPKSLKLYQMNKQMSVSSPGTNQTFSNQSQKNITPTMIHSTYGQPTPPPTKPPVSSKAPAVYHNVSIPSPTIETYQQQHQYQSQQQQQQHHLQQNPSQPPTPQSTNNNSSNNNQSIINNRHNDLLSPIDSQIWAPIQYSWVQTHYNPSSTLLECLKRLVNSIVVFSNEIGVEYRLKLINFLNILGSPSSESQYNTPSSKTVLSCIDSIGFNITRHYQMLYQTISKHHSMMEDQFVPLTEVYFDENEINRFLIFSEQAQNIEENFEYILRELSNVRDSFIMKRENIEKNIVESSKMISYSHNSISNCGSNINLEQAKQDTARLLETLAPLESTLNGMETKFKSIQREIGMVQRVFSFFELLYNIHINHHQPIIEKHSKQLSTYIIDVMQQTLFNCDVLSVAYNKMKSSLSSINQNNSNNNNNNNQNDDDSLIDNSNPFISKLNDLLNKYENIKYSSPINSTSNNNNNNNSSNSSSNNHFLNSNNNNLQLYQQPQQSKEKKVLAVYHNLCLEHRVPEDHPESPKRLQAVIRAINDFSKQSDRLIIKDDPEDANDKWILTVHSPEYLKQLEELTDKLESNETRPLNVNNDGAQTGINQFNNNSNNGECEDGDTFVSKQSLRAAKRSAGATLYAIDNVMKGQVTSAFVAARPPGHHAGRDGLTSGTSSQGFCLLNHVCIGAKYAQLKYNLEKIAIIDFDVHHGNGTEEILANDQGFYFLSIHMFEEGFYPGSGGANSQSNINDDDTPITIASSSSSNVVNIPLDPKSSANSFLKAFSVIIDKLNDYQPELILISCGFDAHLEDHLASLCLLEENYVEITRQLRKVADRWCKGRLVSILEGGYNINALRQCTIAHLTALVESDND